MLSFAKTLSDPLGAIRGPRHAVRPGSPSLPDCRRGSDPPDVSGQPRPGRSTEDRGSSLTDVATVHDNFGKLHDLPYRGERDRSNVGCVLFQREVGPRLMVVDEIAGQDAAEVLLAQDEHVIQALAPDRADEPLHERLLPPALRRR